jgi:hypothetical protein
MPSFAVAISAMRIAPPSRHTSRMLALTPEAVGAVVEFVVGQDAGTAAGLRISPGRHSAVDRTWDYSVVHEPFEGDVMIEDGRHKNGLATGNDGGGARSLRPSAPLTEPNNRMVEPETEGRSDFPFWAPQ